MNVINPNIKCVAPEKRIMLFHKFMLAERVRENQPQTPPFAQNDTALPLKQRRTIKRMQEEKDLNKSHLNVFLGVDSSEEGCIL